MGKEIGSPGREVKAASILCSTICDPMDCNSLGSSVYGIFQARILKGVAISYSRESSCSRDQTCNSHIGKQVLYHCATWEAQRQPRHGALISRLVQWPGQAWTLWEGMQRRLQSCPLWRYLHQIPVNSPLFLGVIRASTSCLPFLPGPLLTTKH